LTVQHFAILEPTRCSAWPTGRRAAARAGLTADARKNQSIKRANRCGEPPHPTEEQNGFAAHSKLGAITLKSLRKKVRRAALATAGRVSRGCRKLPKKYANRQLHVLLAFAAFNDASRAKSVQNLLRTLSTKSKCKLDRR
jgi:hypothetical protein